MAFTLFRQIVGLFLMIACGFILVKAGAAKSEDSRVLSRISIYLVQPCVILRAFQTEFTPGVRRGFLLAVGCALCIYACLLALDQVYRRALRLDPVERASIIYSNSGNLLIPIVSSMFGAEWVIYASAYMLVQLCILWTQGVSLIRGEKGFQLKKIVTNNNLITIAVGILLMALGIQLPEIVARPIGDVANIFGPISMIMIGMIFAGADLSAIVRNRRIYFVAFLCMIVSPLALLLVLRLTGIAALAEEGYRIVYIGLLSVMTPSATLITQLSQFYGKDSAKASAINVITTLCCIVTMPLITALYAAVM